MSAFANLWSELRSQAAMQPYLLIDCAGIDGGEAGLPRAIFGQLECLFTGDLADELSDVSPYLAQLKSCAPEVTDIADDLLARDLAVLVLPPAPHSDFAQLHRHFRKFNVVYGPKGQPLFFRYYDPRVLRQVFGVLEPTQVVNLFGPIREFVLSGPEQAMQRYECKHGRLACRTSPAASSAG